MSKLKLKIGNTLPKQEVIDKHKNFNQFITNYKTQSSKLFLRKIIAVNTFAFIVILGTTVGINYTNYFNQQETKTESLITTNNKKQYNNTTKEKRTENALSLSQIINSKKNLQSHNTRLKGNFIKKHEEKEKNHLVLRNASNNKKIALQITKKNHSNTEQISTNHNHKLQQASYKNKKDTKHIKQNSKKEAKFALNTETKIESSFTENLIRNKSFNYDTINSNENTDSLHLTQFSFQQDSIIADETADLMSVSDTNQIYIKDSSLTNLRQYKDSAELKKYAIVAGLSTFGFNYILGGTVGFDYQKNKKLRLGIKGLITTYRFDDFNDNSYRVKYSPGILSNFNATTSYYFIGNNYNSCKFGLYGQLGVGYFFEQVLNTSWFNNEPAIKNRYRWHGINNTVSLGTSIKVGKGNLFIETTGILHIITFVDDNNHKYISTKPSFSNIVISVGYTYSFGTKKK